MTDVDKSVAAGKATVTNAQVRDKSVVLKNPAFCNLRENGKGHNGNEYSKVSNTPAKTKGIISANLIIKNKVPMAAKRKISRKLKCFLKKVTLNFLFEK